MPEDLSAFYPPPIAGRLNIGVLHTSAEDPGEHATYAPCRVESLALKGYAYWALGHIHQRRTLRERPWIVFPGNIQGRNARETGAKGCAVVEVEDGRIVGVTHRATDVLRWAQVAVDAGGAHGPAEIAARLRLALADAQATAEGRPLIVRITLAGATAQHAAMLADPETLDAECRNAAASVGGELHVERVRLQTRMPAGHAGAADDRVAQLAGPFQAALDDPDTIAGLLRDVQALAAQIPRLAGRPAPDLPLTAEALRALAPDAWQTVAHALTGGAAE